MSASLLGEPVRRDSLGMAGYAGMGVGNTGHGARMLAGEEAANGGLGRRGSIPISIPYDKRGKDANSVSSASIAEDDDDEDEDEAQEMLDSVVS